MHNVGSDSNSTQKQALTRSLHGDDAHGELWVQGVVEVVLPRAVELEKGLERSGHSTRRAPYTGPGEDRRAALVESCHTEGRIHEQAGLRKRVPTAFFNKQLLAELEKALRPLWQVVLERVLSLMECMPSVRAPVCR